MGEDNILDFYPQGEEYDDSTVTLVDQDGNEVDMAVVDVVEHKGEKYVILLPIENIREPLMEFTVLRIDYDESTGEEIYVSGNEVEFDEVFVMFQEQLEREIGDAGLDK